MPDGTPDDEPVHDRARRRDVLDLALLAVLGLAAVLAAGALV